MISISETVAQLGSDDQSKAYQARRKLAETVDQASKDESVALAGALAEELSAKVKTEGKDGKPGGERNKYPAAVRSQVAQYLAQVAGDAQVPAFVAALNDLETREMARWALDRIPTAAATAALIAALEQVGPEFRVGVINALAKRKAPDVLKALHGQAADSDSEVRSAAVEALANFPEPSNDDAIVAATKTGSLRSRTRAQKARVRLADALRLAGKKDAAVAIYKAILANDAEEPQKKAARLALERLT